MGSSHVVFLNIFFYGDVTQKRHWQKNLPVGFNGLTLLDSEKRLIHLNPPINYPLLRYKIPQL